MVGPYVYAMINVINPVIMHSCQLFYIITTKFGKCDFFNIYQIYIQYRSYYGSELGLG